MNILFLYISLPNIDSKSVFTDLIREFQSHGHNILVAAPAMDNSSIGVTKRNGIKELRFKTDRLTTNKSNVQKGIAYIKLIWQYPHAILKSFGNEKIDIIIGHSLPPELGVIIPRLKKHFKCRFYLKLCEFIWQDSVALGFYGKHSPICWYYKSLEARLIKSADYIGCPSQKNIDFALRYHPWASKKDIHILNYCLDPLNDSTIDTSFRSKYHLEKKYIAIYGGSITIAQKIENVIDLAESCAEYNDIVFCIVGRGFKFDVIKQEAIKKGLANILFLDYMPNNEYLSLLKSCDVGIVSLNEKLQMPNIPSKTLTLFNLKKPIVASIDYSTDYGLLLEKIGAGKWSYAGDLAKFKENLLSLYNDRILGREMGEKGFDYYINNMTPSKSYETIMKHINSNSIINY